MPRPRAKKVSLGSAVLANWGGLVGWGHGLSLWFMLGGERMRREQQVLAFLTTTLSVLEFTAGAVAAERSDLSAGDAALIGSGALYGGLGLGAMTLTAVWDLDEDAILTAVGATALVGSIGGAIGGNFLRQSRRLTLGDASLVSTSVLLGMYAGVVASDWFGALDRSETARWLPMLGAIGGVAGGWYGLGVGEGHHLTTGQGMIIDMSTTAGGAVGAGLVLATGAESATAFLTVSLVGAIIGYGVSSQAMLNEKTSTAWLDDKLRGLRMPTLSPWFGPDRATGVSLGGRF